MAENNGIGIKNEIYKGLAKGGPTAILLGMVLYWVLNVMSSKLDKSVEIQQESLIILRSIDRRANPFQSFSEIDPPFAGREAEEVGSYQQKALPDSPQGYIPAIFGPET